MDGPNLFEEVAARIRREPGAFAGTGDIAKSCGLARSALNDLFREHAHESPAAFLRRARLEDAMELLRTGVNPAVGGERTSGFHPHFTARTGMTPTAYAALAGAAEFDVRLPARYRIAEVLRFFGRDEAGTSERVTADSVTKCVLIDGRPAVVEIRFKRGTARCRTDAANVFAAHGMVVRMLGLDSAGEAFEREFSSDPLLGGVIRKQRGLRIPLTPEPWEALAWAICGQQISVKAAVALRRELILAAGTRHSSGLRAHPTPAQVAGLGAEQLRGLKFSRSKADYILAAARAVDSGEVPVNGLRGFSAVRAAELLKAVRGIGNWTVQYTLLRGLGFTDCLPAGDAGLARGLEQLRGSRPDESAIGEIMSVYSPWRSYATYHVWASLKGAGE